MKIGETKRLPVTRLKNYDVGPHEADMNHIYTTSNCKSAEKEIGNRLKLAGYKPFKRVVETCLDYCGASLI